MLNIAGIVTFNPAIDKLKLNIESIRQQVDKVIIFDNGSKNINSVEKLSSEYKNLLLIKSKVNCGMASALNALIHKSEEFEAEWILTLDQDSVCPPNLITNYTKYLKFPKVAIIAPQIYLQGGRIIQKTSKGKQINDYEYVERCITSASYINVPICKAVGYFDDILFIDYVDHEYCKRLLIHGYKILKANNVIIRHELGSNVPFRWSVLFHKILHTKIIFHEHNPLRVYYIERNVIYYLRKFKFQMQLKEVIFELYVLLHTALKHVILENQRLSYIKAICKALHDGFYLKISNKR